MNIYEYLQFYIDNDHVVDQQQTLSSKRLIENLIAGFADENSGDGLMYYVDVNLVVDDREHCIQQYDSVQEVIGSLHQAYAYTVYVNSFPKEYYDDSTPELFVADSGRFSDQTSGDVESDDYRISHFALRSKGSSPRDITLGTVGEIVRISFEFHSRSMSEADRARFADATKQLLTHYQQDSVIKDDQISALRSYAQLVSL